MGVFEDFTSAGTFRLIIGIEPFDSFDKTQDRSAQDEEFRGMNLEIAVIIRQIFLDGKAASSI